MACKGVCNHYKITKRVNRCQYTENQKRCQWCSIFIKWDGIWCPCCNHKLRSRPRNSKSKQNFLKKNNSGDYLWHVRESVTGTRQNLIQMDYVMPMVRRGAMSVINLYTGMEDIVLAVECN